MNFPFSLKFIECRQVYFIIIIISSLQISQFSYFFLGIIPLLYAKLVSLGCHFTCIHSELRMSELCMCVVNDYLLCDSFFSPLILFFFMYLSPRVLSKYICNK